jgi:hypothetical protein
MKRKPLPRIPPIPLEILKKVEAVEESASKALEDCDHIGFLNVEKTRRILRTCVVEVFDLQMDYYASLPNFDGRWARELKLKTISSVIGLFPAYYHSGDRFRNELSRTIDDHQAQKAILNLPKGKAQADRRALRDAYLRRFPQVKKLDICWAAGQRYSEWKRWLRHVVKDGSAPDRAFRSLLSGDKSPSEYRKQPRPNGWK